MGFITLQRSLLWTLILTIITISQSQDTGDNPSRSHHFIPTQSDMQNKQHSLEEQFKKQVEEQLNPWVVEQLHTNEQHPEVQPYETVTFYLQPNVTHVYRVPVSLQQTMNIDVSLYHVGPDGEITIPQNPEQDQYVQLTTTTDSNSRKQYHEGNVYISRIFQIEFPETHKILKVRNNKNEAVVVLIDMEQQEMLMELAVSDDKFELTNKKMQALLKQTKETEVNRQHMYKWQWGFYQKHQRHQVDMLGFTGAQLFAIIGTSIVQMFCIKNMIDNQLII